MARRDKILNKILHGKADGNIPFLDPCNLLLQLGFNERVQGSHHIFTKEDVEEIVNLQPIGSKAKRYQVKQYAI